MSSIMQEHRDLEKRRSQSRIDLSSEQQSMLRPESYSSIAPSVTTGDGVMMRRNSFGSIINSTIEREASTWEPESPMKGPTDNRVSFIEDVSPLKLGIEDSTTKFHYSSEPVLLPDGQDSKTDLNDDNENNGKKSGTIAASVPKLPIVDTDSDDDDVFELVSEEENDEKEDQPDLEAPASLDSRFDGLDTLEDLSNHKRLTASTAMTEDATTEQNTDYTKEPTYQEDIVPSVEELYPEQREVVLESSGEMYPERAPDRKGESTAPQPAVDRLPNTTRAVRRRTPSEESAGYRNRRDSEFRRRRARRTNENLMLNIVNHSNVIFRATERMLCGLEVDQDDWSLLQFSTTELDTLLRRKAKAEARLERERERDRQREWDPPIPSNLEMHPGFDDGRDATPALPAASSRRGSLFGGFGGRGGRRCSASMLVNCTHKKPNELVN